MMSNRHPPEVSDAEEPDAEEADEHLRDLEDGAGCTEIWAHLSEQRAGSD
jgi:hypothetical protein